MYFVHTSEFYWSSWKYNPWEKPQEDHHIISAIHTLTSVHFSSKTTYFGQMDSGLKLDIFETWRQKLFPVRVLKALFHHLFLTDWRTSFPKMSLVALVVFLFTQFDQFDPDFNGVLPAVIVGGVRTKSWFNVMANSSSTNRQEQIMIVISQLAI